MPNLYGDIISDLTSGLIGGLGLLPSVNMNDEYAIFEAVHGSALDIANKNIANPTAFILSACMMLEHLGFEKEATTIKEAIECTFNDLDNCTADLGGKASTLQYTQNIINNMAKINHVNINKKLKTYKKEALLNFCFFFLNLRVCFNPTS